MYYAVEVHSGRTKVDEIVAADTQDAAINTALSRHQVGCVVKGVYPATAEQVAAAGGAAMGGPASLDEAMQLETRAEFEDAAVAMGMVIGHNWTDTMLRVAVLEQVALRRGGQFEIQIGSGNVDVSALNARIATLEATVADRDGQIAVLEALNAPATEDADQPLNAADPPPKRGK